VLGSRYVEGGGTVNWGFGRRLLSKGGSFYARTILGLPIRDLTGGFKCFRREVLEAIDLPTVRSSGYAFQIELTYRAIKRGFRVRAETGWRKFEVTARAEIARPQGVSRAWLPVPFQVDSAWQRALGNTWAGNAARMEEARIGKYGVPLFYAEWAPGTEAPFVEL